METEGQKFGKNFSSFIDHEDDFYSYHKKSIIYLAFPS